MKRAFTLIEMLVSLTITMMMMFAVVTLFQVMTDSVSGSRALLETADRLRACRNRLQADLQGATATMSPPLRPESDEGYFEIIEGPANDVAYTIGGGPTTFGSRAAIIPPATPPNQSLFGDIDDVLMFTVRSRGEPFVGKLSTAPSGTYESQSAEVIYFVVANGPIIDPTTTPPTHLCTLYRRVLLIAPGLTTTSNPTIPAVSTGFFDNNDLSARFLSSGPAMVANTLGDLTKRESRFAHFPAVASGAFPYDVSTTGATAVSGQPTNNALLAPLSMTVVPPTTRQGDDVILTNVLAFDVQVWDPNAPVYTSTGVAVDPRDQGYLAAYGAVPPSFGAYVDLGYAINYSTSGIPVPVFYNTPVGGIRSILPAGVTLGLTPLLPLLAQNTAYGGTPTTAYTYDTWSLHYENDGVQQNSAHIADAGTNGLDDAVNGTTDGVVDDPSEFDTQPPFAAKLRGVRVTVRVYEPSSQQVREITVVQDFLPE